MKDYSGLDDAIKDLDELTYEGVFGESVKDLRKQRENMGTTDYLYNSFLEILDKKIYGTKSTIGIMLLIMDLFREGIEAKGQEALDVVTAFYKGTKEHPELECISSFNEYLFSHANYKKINKDYSKKKTSVFEAKHLASVLIDTYTKGVEMVNKIFTFMLTIQQIISNEEYSIIDNAYLTAYRKFKEFEEKTNDKYKKLTMVINRDIRNADAHLNILYSYEKKAFLIKKLLKGSGEGKGFENIEIPAQEMILEIFPKIGWFVQGYFCACILIVLAFDDKEKYKLAVEHIKKLNA